MEKQRIIAQNIGYVENLTKATDAADQKKMGKKSKTFIAMFVGIAATTIAFLKLKRNK